MHYSRTFSAGRMDGLLELRSISVWCKVYEGTDLLSSELERTPGLRVLLPMLARHVPSAGRIV